MEPYGNFVFNDSVKVDPTNNTPDIDSGNNNIPIVENMPNEERWMDTYANIIFNDKAREDAELFAFRNKLVSENHELVEVNGFKRYKGKGRVRLAQPMADKFLTASKVLKSKHGITLQIQDAYRHPDAQQRQYHKYLADVAAGKNSAKVASPDTSFHTIGYAFDLAQTNKMMKSLPTIRKELENVGIVQHKFEWWHFSLGNNSSTQENSNAKMEDLVVEYHKPNEEHKAAVVSIDAKVIGLQNAFLTGEQQTPPN